MTDEVRRIIQACQRGDASAFRQLVTLHYDYVYRLAFRVLLDRDEAADAAQEVFIKVWRTIGTFTPTMRFTTWLYRIVVNTALDARRHRVRREALAATSADEFGTLNGPDKQAEGNDLAGIAVSLLSHLSPTQRMIVALRDFEDLSPQEVASITGISESSVKANLSYARKKLRELFASDYGVTETGL